MGAPPVSEVEDLTVFKGGGWEYHGRKRPIAVPPGSDLSLTDPLKLGECSQASSEPVELAKVVYNSVVIQSAIAILMLQHDLSQLITKELANCHIIIGGDWNQRHDSKRAEKQRQWRWREF